MGRKSKYSKELKMEIVKRYERGEDSYESLANEVGVNSGTIRKWFVQYKNLGASAFDEESRNKSYTKEFKEEVIQAYLNGKGSYLDVATAFDIPSDTTVINWVKKYNGHIEQFEELLTGSKKQENVIFNETTKMPIKDIK